MKFLFFLVFLSACNPLKTPPQGQESTDQKEEVSPSDASESDSYSKDSTLPLSPAHQ